MHFHFFLQILAFFCPRFRFQPISFPAIICFMLGLAISHLAIYSQLHFAFNDIFRLQTFRWKGYFSLGNALYEPCFTVAIGKVTRNYNGNARQCQISLACHTKCFFFWLPDSAGNNDWTVFHLRFVWLTHSLFQKVAEAHFLVTDLCWQSSHAFHVNKKTVSIGIFSWSYT